MKPDASDRDLAQRFSDMRAADARTAPSFPRVMARQRTSARRPLWPAFAGGLALVAIAVVWHLTTSPGQFALRAGDLRVPTDFLLELVTIPRAGEIPKVGIVDWYPLESSTQARRTQ